MTSCQTLGIMIRPCTSPDDRVWLALRRALWPHVGEADHIAEMSRFCAESERFAQFIVESDGGEPLGLAEVSVRHDYVNGTSSSPVAFLEGIYVVPPARRRGVARTLVRAAERWASGKGCKELASDASVENSVSHAMHRALGFEETERVVFFRKALEAD